MEDPSREHFAKDVSQKTVLNLSDFGVIPRASMAKVQALYIGLCHVMPFIGTMIAIGLIPIWPPTMGILFATLAMWAVTLGAGITVGFHRLFSHRAFRTTTAMRVLLAICGSMAGQTPLIAWVALHRCHHQHTDVEGDPHSPWPNGPTWFQKLVGLWHAHVGWMTSKNFPDSLRYCPDLIRDRTISRISRLFLVWYLLGIAVPAIAIGMLAHSWQQGILGFLWAGCFRVTMTSQATWSINSLCHFFGYVSHKTDDHSTNLALLALPTFGESWHNNHHACPQSAMFGHRYWELDLGYGLIWCFERLGLAWDVQKPESRGDNIR